MPERPVDIVYAEYSGSDVKKYVPSAEVEHLRAEGRAKLAALVKGTQRILTHFSKLGDTAYKMVTALAYHAGNAEVVADPRKHRVYFHFHSGLKSPGYEWLAWGSRIGLSLWVRDVAGNEHLVPLQWFDPWEFLSTLERLVNDPNVAKVDVRVLGRWTAWGWRQETSASDMAKVWGRIVVAKRYSNVDALIKGLQPPPPPPPEDKTVIATGPAAEAWKQSAQTPSGISPQGVPSGGSFQTTQVATGKIDPRWALVAGAGILLLALIMRR